MNTTKTRWSIERVKGFIEQQRYILLSQEYKNAHTKLNIECNKGHKYQATWDKFRQGCRCPYCAGKKVTFEQVKDYIEQQGYILLSKEYINCKTKLLVQCPKGHKWGARYNDFQQGYRCPTCNESKGERRIVEALDRMKLYYVREYKLNDTRLRLDFFIPSLNLGIEYDGEHHFRPVQFGGMSPEKAQKEFLKIQKRDARKNKLCKGRDIKLIRIKYDENIDFNQKITSSND